MYNFVLFFFLRWYVTMPSDIFVVLLRQDVTGTPWLAWDSQRPRIKGVQQRAGLLRSELKGWEEESRTAGSSKVQTLFVLHDILDSVGPLTLPSLYLFRSLTTLKQFKLCSHRKTGNRDLSKSTLKHAPGWRAGFVFLLGLFPPS